MLKSKLIITALFVLALSTSCSIFHPCKCPVWRKNAEVKKQTTPQVS